MTGGKLRVGLVTDVGKVNDGTFNQYANRPWMKDVWVTDGK